MVSIQEIKDPTDRFMAYIEERNNIYLKKTAEEPWPWTDDHILQTYRFTEIYRERDRVSLHYQKMVRDRYGESVHTLPATVLYRWFNRPETCEALFGGNNSPFDQYLDTLDKQYLIDCIDKLPPPHITGAFIITGKPGFTKALGVIEYFDTWMHTHNWLAEWGSWRVYPPSLDEMSTWLNGDGLGSFLRAQLVADLKYVPFLKKAPDWWTWAAPGPGSMRGLNAVLSRPMDKPWDKKEWLTEIRVLNAMENIHFKDHATIQPFHAQDTQNHCCEFSKYTKVMLNLGRPRQVYRRENTNG